MNSMKNLLKSVVVASGVLLAANTASAQQKIGHINTAEIVQATPEFKAAEEQMKTLSDANKKKFKGCIPSIRKNKTTRTRN